MAKIQATYQRVSALIKAHLSISHEYTPDYAPLYQALQELASEVLQEVGWSRIRVNGYFQGGTEAAWKCWLSEFGPTYKGVVRLQVAIMSVAYAADTTTRVEELSA